MKAWLNYHPVPHGNLPVASLLQSPQNGLYALPWGGDEGFRDWQKIEYAYIGADGNVYHITWSWSVRELHAPPMARLYHHIVIALRTLGARIPGELTS